MANSTINLSVDDYNEMREDIEDLIKRVNILEGDEDIDDDVESLFDDEKEEASFDENNDDYEEDEPSEGSKPVLIEE